MGIRAVFFNGVLYSVRHSFINELKNKYDRFNKRRLFRSNEND